MAFFGGELSGTANNLVGRNFNEPLLGIFVFAGKCLLFLAVAKVQSAAQRGNVVSFRVGDRRREQMAKLLDHRGRN